jgi:predicted glycosyltransferase
LKILLDIGHPKDVNVFKNVILSLQNRGHEIKVVARAKENTKKILGEYGFQCEFGPYYKNIVGKAFGVIRNDIWLFNIARKFQPDIFISPGSPYSAHVSRLLGKPHLAFIDTEIAGLAIKLMLPFTDKIYTSTSFYLDFGLKQVRFNGYYELAYLHPKYFTPNKEVLKKYDLEDDYIILRLSALASHHDVGASGFSFETEEELKSYIAALEKYGRVVISSETDQWPTITDYQLKFDPKDLHDILYFAKLYIGEGATMASESAILGVPAIYVSNTRRGYLDELEKTYDLAFTIRDKQDALEKVVLLLGVNDLEEKWHSKRDKMLGKVTDTVEFMVDVIEKYHQRLRQN